MPGAATTRMAFCGRRKTMPRLPELRRLKRKTTRAGKRPAAGEDERGRAVFPSVFLPASVTRGG